MNISIILIEPEHPGNLGAIARAMKNFGYKNLLLVNPKCKTDDPEAKNRAKHAQEILADAKIINTTNKTTNDTRDILADNFDYLIATTAKVGTDYNLHRSPITPEQLREKKLKGKVGIVIGKESSGLSNKEIERCDFILSIPSSTIYPTLNISHAITIILYELSKETDEKKVGDQIEIASRTDRNMILKRIDELLDSFEFRSPEKKETQKKVWKLIVSKSNMTKREAFALLGFFRKLKNVKTPKNQK